MTRADVAIVGGGVAGLWCRWALERAGYSTVTIEHQALGAGQTGASQGILHAGVKYAMSGLVGEDSRGLDRARPRWESALAGMADSPDLSRVVRPADRMHLWTQAGMVSRLTGVLGAAFLSAKVRKIEGADRPAFFRAAPATVRVWEVMERAVDALSLVQELARAAGGPMVKTAAISVTAGAVRTAGGPIAARAVVLAAGAGNESLLISAGNTTPTMQRRPLHMVMVNSAPEPVWGHCVKELSDKPRLTVTSARSGGGWVWYVGGNLAETGVERSETDQVRGAREELSQCIPWLDLSGSRMATLRIDRAEGITPGGGRPTGPVVKRSERVVAVWPTKLALAPLAADEVVEHVRAVVGKPGPQTGGSVAGLPTPGLAPPLWEGRLWR